MPSRRRTPIPATSCLLAGFLLAAGRLAAQTAYPLGPDSERPPGVPTGTVTRHTWKSAIFPGTVRDYWIYVPAQYRPEAPVAVMVFQDGAGFVNPEGRWRVPIVFDNLIHKSEMPVTIGLFIDPDVLRASSADQQARYNRSFEYDGLGDRYARFLLEELLPEIARTHNLTSDPNFRAIGGSSSGASCAFTVAWNRPDAFRRVLSFIGSYTNLRGAEVYPSLIRKTEPKPLRVFLQDGKNDLNLYSGNWWIGNQAMWNAFEYAGYDATFVTGDQAHNNIHGSAILPTRSDGSGETGPSPSRDPQARAPPSAISSPRSSTPAPTGSSSPKATGSPKASPSTATATSTLPTPPPTASIGSSTAPAKRPYSGRTRAAPAG